MVNVSQVRLVSKVLGTSPLKLSLTDLRKSIRNKRSRNANATELWAAEVATHRNTSKSSILRGRVSVADGLVGEDASGAAFSPKYKQDSEAYKRRPGIKDDIMNLLKQGGRVLGFRV